MNWRRRSRDFGGAMPDPTRSDLLSRARFVLECYTDDQLDRMTRTTLERFGEPVRCGSCGVTVYDTPMVGQGRLRLEADGTRHPFACGEPKEDGGLPLAGQERPG